MMVQYASTTDSVTIEGVYWVDTVVTGAIFDGSSNSITATLKDIDNDTVTTFSGDFTVTAQDDNGLIVQVSADGIAYTDSIDITAISGAYIGEVYFSLPATAEAPISVRFQVASADIINGYQPYGVAIGETYTFTYQNTDKDFTQGEDGNSPFTGITWALNGQVVHGFSGVGDGIGWTLGADISEVSVNIGFPDSLTFPAHVTVMKNDVSAGKLYLRTEDVTTISTNNRAGITLPLSVSASLGDTIKIVLDAADAAQAPGNLFMLDCMFVE